MPRTRLWNEENEERCINCLHQQSHQRACSADPSKYGPAPVGKVSPGAAQGPATGRDKHSGRPHRPGEGKGPQSSPTTPSLTPAGGRPLGGLAVTPDMTPECCPTPPLSCCFLHTAGSDGPPAFPTSQTQHLSFHLSRSEPAQPSSRGSKPTPPPPGSPLCAPTACPVPKKRLLALNVRVFSAIFLIILSHRPRAQCGALAWPAAGGS